MADPAKAIHLVLDNFRIHSSKQVQAWMAQNGKRVRLHFLPPYCPDENKIERTWRDLHADVTRNHRHTIIEALMRAVRDWIDQRNRKASATTSRRAA